MLNDQNSYRENFFIMFGHFANDLCQAALPAILAFMFEEGRLDSYAQAALLISACTIINAVAQPLTGYIADHRPRPYLMWTGMLLSAVGIMFIGLIESFPLMLLMVSLNGIGTAAFHPPAGKLAGIFAGKKAGRGMSIFSVGGSIGFAFGPLYMTGLYLLFGLKGTLLLFLPALIMTVGFLRRARLYRIASLRDHRRRNTVRAIAASPENYPGMVILTGLIFARSAATFGLTTFLPLYFMHVLNQPETLSTLTNSIMAGIGIIATITGGIMADRMGFTRWVRLVSFLVLPFMTLFILTSNALLAITLLLPTAFFYYCSQTPVVVIGQKLLPRHAGMATGITIGLGVSFGGCISPLLGMLGDHCGLTATMAAIAVLCALSALISLFLPRVDH